MSRYDAREAAFRLVYEKCVCGDGSELTYKLLTGALSDDDAAYVGRLTGEIEQHRDILEKTLAEFSNGFALDRIYKTDLAILFIAACEILYFEDVPDSVSANEAVELAKKYSTEASPKFVNGVIASVIKNKERILNECEDN